MKKLLLLLLLIPSLLWGADQNIYLDNGGAGAGSIGDPYGAFSQINWSATGANSITDWVVGGDTVFINLKKGVTWREVLTVGASGASGRPITIQAYSTGNSPIIDGSTDVSETWADQTGNAWLHNIGATEPKQVFFDGVRQTFKTWDTDISTTALSAGEWTYDNPNLYIYATSDPDSGSVLIEASQITYCINMTGKDYITIDGITVQKANGSGIYIVGNSDNTIIKNSTATQNRDWGIVVLDAVNSQDDGLIDLNTLSYNGQSGFQITAKADGWTISNNIINNNAWSSDAITAGIRLDGSGAAALTDMTIEYNSIYSNGPTVAVLGQAFGILVFASQNVSLATGITTRYNRIYNNGASGIQIEKTSYSSVYGNVIYGNAQTIVDSTGGIRCTTGGGITGQENVFYNNTMYDNKFNVLFDSFTGTAGTLNNNMFRNNILIGGAFDMVINGGASNDGIKGTGNTYNNNCHGVEATNFIAWRGVTYDTYDTWISASSQTDNNVEVAPLFTDAVNDILTIQSTSPVIGVGANIAGFEDKLEPSSTWPGNVYTKEDLTIIGAYVSIPQSSPGSRYSGSSGDMPSVDIILDGTSIPTSKSSESSISIPSSY